MPSERIPTKKEMDRLLDMDTERPTIGQTARVLGCSARHVSSLMVAGHLTKGADIRRQVSEWVTYQIELKMSGRVGRRPGGGKIVA